MNSSFENSIWSDYGKTKPTSRSTNTANGVKFKTKMKFIPIFEMTSEFNIQIINSITVI